MTAADRPLDRRCPWGTLDCRAAHDWDDDSARMCATEDALTQPAIGGRPAKIADKATDVMPVLCPKCQQVKGIQACAVRPCPCSCHLIERATNEVTEDTCNTSSATRSSSASGSSSSVSSGSSGSDVSDRPSEAKVQPTDFALLLDMIGIVSRHVPPSACSDAELDVLALVNERLAREQRSADAPLRVDDEVWIRGRVATIGGVGSVLVALETEAMQPKHVWFMPDQVQRRESAADAITECSECEGTGIIEACDPYPERKCHACEPPSEDVLRIVHAFGDEERKDLVRELAARVKATETALANLRRASDSTDWRSIAAELTALVIWMSGSADFSPTGAAGDGWRVKGLPTLKRALDAARAAHEADEGAGR